MRFKDKVVLVTGAGRGIGRATALRFAAEEAKLGLCDRIPDYVDSVAAEIRASGGEAWATGCDVQYRNRIEAMVAGLIERFGRVDVLFNNAGISPIAPFLETRDDQWDETLAVNLTGCFLCGQVVAQQMVRQEGGVIVNMASTNGLVGEAELVAYNASKFGVVGLTLTMAIELAPYGIRVNAVAPGFIATDLNRAFWEDPAISYNYVNQKIPLRRLGRPEDVAGAVLFLASDDAAYITGHTLVIDGGQLTS